VLDLKLALRLMARTWGFSLALIVILGLCIGASTAVLSIVNAVMVRPLPCPEPERLMQVVTSYPHDASALNSSVDSFTWELVRDRARRQLRQRRQHGGQRQRGAGSGRAGSRRASSACSESPR
jgi:hypothetical protein